MDRDGNFPLCDVLMPVGEVLIAAASAVLLVLALLVKICTDDFHGVRRPTNYQA